MEVEEPRLPASAAGGSADASASFGILALDVAATAAGPATAVVASVAGTALICHGHTDVVFSCCFTPDGRFLLSGSADRAVRLWDAATTECVRVMTGHLDWVTAVAAAPGGDEVVSCGADALVIVWRLRDGACLRTLEGHGDMVRSVAVSPDKRCIVSGGYDRTTRVWDFVTGVCLKVVSDGGSLVEAVACCGQWVLSASESALRVYDTETLTVRRVLRGHGHCINAVAVTPDGRRAVTASSDRSVRLWDLRSGECVKSLTGHQKMVLHVAVSRCGRWAASSSWDSAIVVWRLPSGEAAAVLENHVQHVNVVEFSPDGRQLAAGTDECLLSVWELERVTAPFFALRWAVVTARWHWQRNGDDGSGYGGHGGTWRQQGSAAAAAAAAAAVRKQDKEVAAAAAAAAPMYAPAHGGGWGAPCEAITPPSPLLSGPPQPPAVVRGGRCAIGNARWTEFLAAVCALPDPAFQHVVTFMPGVRVRLGGKVLGTTA
ncbi:unnamed protein product [Phaeothamnion confervicola]